MSLKTIGTVTMNNLAR